MVKREKIYTSICSECIDNHWKWSDCKGFDSYQPEDLCYCFHQVMWLIEHAEAEHWPKAESGYVDNPEGHSSVRSAKAPFIIIKDNVSEIFDRLKTCGDAGEALIGEIAAGVKIGLLSGPAYRALQYVSGQRKRMTFPQWDANRTYKARARV